MNQMTTLEAIRLEREDCASNLNLGGLLAGFAFVGVVELSSGQREGTLISIALGSCIVASLFLLTSTMLTNMMITDLVQLELDLRSETQQILYTPLMRSRNSLYELTYLIGLVAIVTAIIMMGFHYSIFLGILALAVVVLAILLTGFVASALKETVSVTPETKRDSTTDN